MQNKKCFAVLLSGGSGTRMGASLPKQYIRVGDRLLITYALETLLMHPHIWAVQIVAEVEWQEIILADLEKNGISRNKISGFSLPGLTRQFSVINGLQGICQAAAAEDVVLIHDAARPNLTARQIDDCLNSLEGHDGVMPALMMKDTLYTSKDGRAIAGLMKRDEIFAGQAPELFLYGSYYEANKRLMPVGISKIKGSTEPAILAGMDIIMIKGDENNYKITTPADLERFCLSVENDKSPF